MADSPLEEASRLSSEPDTGVDSALAGDDDDDVTVTLNDETLVLMVDATFDIITPDEANELKEAAEKRLAEAAAAPAPPVTYKKRKGMFGKRRRGRGRPPSVPKADKADKDEDEPPKPPPEVFIESIEAPAHPAYHFSIDEAYHTYTAPSADYYDTVVEYDLDEQDRAWRKLLLARQAEQKQDESLSEETLELLMDRFEKHSLYKELASQSKRKRKRGKPPRNPPPVTSTTALQPKLPPGIISTTHAEGETPLEDLCAVCLSDEASNTNSIVFCDRCNVGVHQECYGVPFIPEGQWHCKKCRDAPGADVTCALCSMEGGAFLPAESDKGKQWVHAACAKWVPETSFANPAFLEPVRDLDDVPADRFKMTCYVCNRKNGACIQCMKKNCYQAFHVTCAVQAHLTMRYEHDPAHEQVVPVYYCHKHTPPDAAQQPIPLEELDPNLLVAFKHHESIAGPSFRLTIPQVIYEAIAREADVDVRSRVLEQVKNYWMMKRYSRQGAPLLRRLQANASLNRESKKMKTTRLIRKDLEKLRLLAGQTLRREKLKRELVQNMRNSFFNKASPMLDVFQYILDELMKRDSMRIFQAPVDPAEFPNYYVEVDEPMDLSTMQTKIDNGAYDGFADIVYDILLIPDNCFLFNDPGTWWQEQAKTFLFRIQAFLERLAIQLHLAGVDLHTGRLTKPMLEPPVATPQVPHATLPTGFTVATAIPKTEAETGDQAATHPINSAIKPDTMSDATVTAQNEETEIPTALVAADSHDKIDSDDQVSGTHESVMDVAEDVDVNVQSQENGAFNAAPLHGIDPSSFPARPAVVSTVTDMDTIDEAVAEQSDDKAAEAALPNASTSTCAEKVGGDATAVLNNSSSDKPMHAPSDHNAVETGCSPSQTPPQTGSDVDNAATETPTEPRVENGNRHTMEQAEEPATAAADEAETDATHPDAEVTEDDGEGPAKRVKHATEALIDTPSETTEAMLEAQQPASKLEDIATVETEQIGETDLKMDMETGVATEPATETSTGMEAEVEAAAENSIVASVSAVKQAIHATQDMDTSSEQTLVAAEVEQAALPSDAEKAATSNATDIVSSLARKPPPPSASPTPTATGPQLDPQVHVESSYNTMLRRGRPKSKKVVKVVAVPLAVQEGFKPHEDPDITAGLDIIFKLSLEGTPAELDILEKLADIRVKNQQTGMRASNVSKLARELFTYRETIDSRCNASNRHRHVVKSSKSRAPIPETDHVAELWGFVWAKMKGYPFYPALMVDPDAPSAKFPTFVPSASVLKARPRSKTSALVCFFDGTGSWAWLNPDSIKPMFADPELDSNLLSRAPPKHAVAVTAGHQAALELHKEPPTPTKSKSKSKTSRQSSSST